MKLKGINQLIQHVPELQTVRGKMIPILSFIAVFATTSALFLLVDWRFSEWMPDGEIVVMAIGFLLLSRFYSQKQRYQEKYGELAYRNAFLRFNIPGLGILFASIAHMGYMPGPEIPEIWWRVDLIVLGYLFITIGAVLWLRSVAAIGIDYLTMLYLYFPADSRLEDSRIYSILRHPIYAAALYIGIGLAFAHANWYALVVAVILPIFLTGWIRLVEEKELITRFPNYINHRSRVPAFFPKPSTFPKFLRIIITGT